MEILWHHTLGLAPVGCGHTTYGVVSSFVVVVVSSVVVCSPQLLAHVCHRAPASCTRHRSPRIVLVVPVSALDVAVRIVVVVVVVVVVQILLLPCVPLSSTALMLSPLGGRSAGGSTPATYSPMP